MKGKIYKYQIDHEGMIQIPKNHKILDFQSQNDILTVWAIVNEQSPIIQKLFKIFVTGQDIDDANLIFLKTIQCGGFVLHIFEENFKRSE